MSDQEKPKLPTGLAIGDIPSYASLRAHSDAQQSGYDEAVVGLFRSVSLFSTLDAAQVLEVLRLCTIETWSAGQLLCSEDEAASAMYIIERGEVAVVRRSGGEDVRVAYLGDGAVVGEMALIASAPRSATIEAVSETRAYRLEGRDIEALRRQRSAVAYKIIFQLLITLGDRRQKVCERTEDLFARPAEHIENFERQVRDLAESCQAALHRQEGA